ncbi:hypothetical protein [Mangrovimonas cancribranchiae]|uniref:Uncharacterized protein n=1 Tax=Mangrovimonas cancribranchiae TaxID=3080055 RepID=A0AAU6P8F4_9FLAO
MTQHLGAILIFYRSLITWSFGVTIFITVISPEVTSIALIKLLMVLFLWFTIKEKENNLNHKLMIYKRLDISEFKFFSFIYFLDLIVSLLSFVLIKEFI